MNTNPVSRQKEFVMKFGSLLESGLHSDVEITVGSDIFKAHRAILDIRTNAFVKLNAALSAKFIISQHSAAAVRCFLQYCYIGDYTTDAAKVDKYYQQHEAALHVNVYYLEKALEVDGLGCLAVQKFREYWTNSGAARGPPENDELERLVNEERKEFLKDVKDIWGRANVREKGADKLVDAMLEVVHGKHAELKGVAEYKTMLKELDGFAATLARDYF